MNTVTLTNIYTHETRTFELVSYRFTFQQIWVVKFEGREETLSNAMGWSEVK